MITTGRGSDGSPDESRDVALAAPAPPSDGSQTTTPHPDLISRRAYEMFQLRGGDHGRDQDDWLEAERELNKPVDK